MSKPGVAKIGTPVRSPAMKYDHAAMKKKLKQPQKFVLKKKQKEPASSKSKQQKQVPTPSGKTVTVTKTKAKAKAKAKTKAKKPEQSGVEEGGLAVVTCAGIKRVAQRAGVRQISSKCILAVQDYLTKKAEDCLLHARSSAHYVSNTRTVHSRDLASAFRTVDLGDLVCV